MSTASELCPKIGPAPMMAMDACSSIRSPRNGPYVGLKRSLDALTALLLLTLTAPLLLLAMLLVKLTSRGPALYLQTRLGLYGRPFTIFKLRSMTHECES